MSSLYWTISRVDMLSLEVEYCAVVVWVSCHGHVSLSTSDVKTPGLDATMLRCGRTKLDGDLTSPEISKQLSPRKTALQKCTRYVGAVARLSQCPSSTALHSLVTT